MSHTDIALLGTTCYTCSVGQNQFKLSFQSPWLSEFCLLGLSMHFYLCNWVLLSITLLDSSGHFGDVGHEWRWPSQVPTFGRLGHCRGGHRHGVPSNCSVGGSKCYGSIALGTQGSQPYESGGRETWWWRSLFCWVFVPHLTKWG